MKTAMAQLMAPIVGVVVVVATLAVIGFGVLWQLRRPAKWCV